MGKFICGAVVLLALTGAAHANGNDVSYGVSTGGVYMEATAAVATVSYKFNYAGTNETREKSGGVLGGIKAGWMSSGPIRFGFEAEILGAGLSVDRVQVSRDRRAFNNRTNLIERSAGAETDWVGSVQARFEAGEGLVRTYLVSGVAFQRLTAENAKLFVAEPISRNTNRRPTTLEDAASATSNGIGFTVGAGVNVALDQTFSLSLGYQYYRFKDDVSFRALTRARDTNGIDGDVETQIHSLRVGGTYRF